jgi:RNA polymerase sigma factor (sigma-70 family)
MSSSPLDIDRFRRGDPATMAAVIKILRARARQYLRAHDEVESAVREGLAELLIKLERGERPTRVLTWVLTAGSNAARRVRTRRTWYVPLPSEQHPKYVVSPSSVVQSREQLETINQVIKSMPEATQRALIATIVDGRTTESVAAELEVPSGTIRKDLERARGKFRRALSNSEKYERLLEFAREVRRARETKRGHSFVPSFPRRTSLEGSSAASS